MTDIPETTEMPEMPEMTAKQNPDAEPTREISEIPLTGTDETTQALPLTETTQALPVAEETQALPLTEPTEPTEGTQALPVTEPADATQTLPFARPVPEAQPAAAQADKGAEMADPDAVWSASTLASEPTEPRDLDRPRGPRASTVMWGTFLLACGLLTIVLGLGTHISLTVASIVVLAATGLSLLLVALIPQHSDASA